MGLFSDDLGERLLSNFNSTIKESLDEMGLDQDEQDRIVLNASKSSGPIELRVDYSDFKNHVFFNSAYTSVNIAYARILSDFPSDGTYRDYFEWRKLNNGYENWFFDNYPKQQGFISLGSGTSESVYLKDYENKINVSTSSVTLEFILKPLENFGTFSPVASVLNDARDSGFKVYLEKKAAAKFLTFQVQSASTVMQLSVSVDPYVSSSNHYAFVFNQDSDTLYSYINGVASSSVVGTAVDDFYINQPNVRLGYVASGSTNAFFSGCIDDFRLWTSDRSSFIAKNYFKPIFANPTSSLKVYYKFNELVSYGNKIIDYSGNNLDAAFSGGFALSTSRISGTLGGWFKDGGDPIFAAENSRVTSFVTTQQNSGSLFDETNRNYIFNIVPAFFVDEENAENQKLFLLLLARHYDRLKLYIEHLSNIHNINLATSNDTPDRLMNLVAENYGVDIGDVYDSSDPLQLYFGEGVLGSGSLDSSVELVKNQLKRNVLNNLIYFLKTKSTRESIESILYALGVDTDVVNINEYSLFSGGIETIRHPQVSERRVLKFNSASVANIHSGAYQATGYNTFQVRVLFNSSSTVLSSSILTLYSGSDTSNSFYALQAERENATSLSGIIRLTFRDAGGTQRNIASSLAPLYNNDWYNITTTRRSGAAGAENVIGFYVTQLDYDTIVNDFGISTGSPHLSHDKAGLYLGTSGSNYFSGCMQEFRAWKNYDVTTLRNNGVLYNWGKDYESTEVANFTGDIPNLLVHYKLNDFTASSTNSGILHDYVRGLTSSYANFTTSSTENFPGAFIPRYVQSYSYDVNVNNNKIRTRSEGRKLTPAEQTIDVPFVTVDVSPVVSLNKEIVKFFGGLDKFNNLVGQPYNKYRQEIVKLGQYKYSFFEQRLNSKIDFGAFINLIKWLDNNFTTLLSQFIPLDMISSISNFVIEPNIFDYNKVKYEFPYKVNHAPTIITSSITLTPRLTAPAFTSVAPGDPGRFGAAVSCSAYQPASFAATQSFSTSAGVNFQNQPQRNSIYLSMSNNYNKVGMSGTIGNCFYSPAVSSSNYLRDILHVNTDYYISASSIAYGLSASSGQSFNSTLWTGSLNAVQDQRWMWKVAPGIFKRPIWDYGIGYGGGWGQIRSVSGKSVQTNIGNNTFFSFSIATPQPAYVQYFDDIEERRKVVVLWPNESAYDGTQIYIPAVGLQVTGTFGDGAAAAILGAPLLIDGYRSLSLEAIGNFSNYRVNPAANTSGPGLKLNVQFQFFDKETGENGFESISSGSFAIAGGQYQTDYVPHTFYLYPDLNLKDITLGAENRTFHLGFSRAIPANKFMRVRITPIWLYANNGDWQGNVNLLVKGILSKDDVSSVEIYTQRSV